MSGCWNSECLWEETDWWLPGFQRVFFCCCFVFLRALTAESVSQGVFVSVLKACCVDKVRINLHHLSLLETKHSALWLCVFLIRLSVLGFCISQGKFCLLKIKAPTSDTIQIHSLQAMSERERDHLFYLNYKRIQTVSSMIDNRTFVMYANILKMQLKCINSLDEVGCSVGAVCYALLGKFVSPLISPDRHIQSSQLNWFPLGKRSARRHT